MSDDNISGEDRIMETVTVGGYVAMVEAVGYVAGNRAGYRYTVSGDGVTVTGDDLSTYGWDEQEAMAALGDFLGAYAESVEWQECTGREGENAHLFPGLPVEVARVLADEVWVAYSRDES